MKIFNKIKFNPSSYYLILIVLCVFTFNYLYNKYGSGDGSMIIFVGMIEISIKCLFVIMCLMFFHFKWIEDHKTSFVALNFITICLLIIDIIILSISSK
jgi:uncharacterized membrane protein